jgi:hypothetical protein
MKLNDERHDRLINEVLTGTQAILRIYALAVTTNHSADEYRTMICNIADIAERMKTHVCLRN